MTIFLVLNKKSVKPGMLILPIIKGFGMILSGFKIDWEGFEFG